MIRGSVGVEEAKGYVNHVMERISNSSLEKVTERLIGKRQKRIHTF